MATDDEIKKFFKGIGAVIVTVGVAGAARVVAGSSNKKKLEIGNNDLSNNNGEFDTSVIEEINQLFEKRQIQEQMDEMWALHDAEQKEFQYMGENNMAWNNFERTNYRNSIG